MTPFCVDRFDDDVVVCSRRSLVGYSQYPNEEEVLLSPNTKLTVTGECRMEADGYYRVDLMELKDAKYVF